MATLSFRNVNKVYPNKVQAVFDFNMEVKDKEFIVLVGPSGCGKSTTLRMLAGFEDISKGEIYIDDVLVNRMAPKDRNIAMVFQNYALYPHMTVYDNMAFALKLRKVSKPVFDVDDKNPEYLKEQNEITAKNKQEYADGLAELKQEKATKERIKEFKFAKKNELRVALIKLDEKYSKPILTYDLKKAQDLEEAINQEVNKVKIATTRINKEIDDEVNKPRNLRDELQLEIKQEESDIKVINRDLKKRIKKERNPDKVNGLKAKLEEANENYETTIKSLKEQLENLNSSIDEAKVASLRKELEEVNKLVVDEAKVTALRAELDKVYNTLDQQAYITQHYSSDEIAEKVTETAEILGLTPYLRRKPAALSGGQRQRVALGRAIVRNPKVFLMDEPLSNLDAKLRVQTRGEISKIHQRVGATTIYVTHDQTEAMTMADRIVVMKDGRVQQIGTPKEAYSEPTNIFVAGFIGSPSMNFFNGTFNGKEFVFDGDKAKFTLSNEQVNRLSAYKGKNVIMGIRPEDFYFDFDKSIDHPSKAITVKAELSELLGHEIIVYVEIGGQKAIVKTTAKREINSGDICSFVYDVNKVHFFDPVTTNRIVTKKVETKKVEVKKVETKKVPTKKAPIKSKKKNSKK